MIHLLRVFKLALFFSRLFKSVNVSPEEKDNVTTARGSFLRSSCEKQKEQKKENFQILRKLKEKDVVVTFLFDF